MGNRAGGGTRTRTSTDGALIIPHLVVVDLVHISDIDETYGAYADDECFVNHVYDDNTDDDTDDDTDDYTDDDTNDDTDDDTDDGGRGDLYMIQV